MKLATIITIGVLAAAPAMAQTLGVQPPNPVAANHAAEASHAAGHDAQVEQSQARQDRAVANYDASRGNYGAANAAANASHAASHDAHVDSHIATHDARVAHNDDSYKLQVR